MTAIDPKKAVIALRALHGQLTSQTGVANYKTYAAIRVYCDAAFAWCDENEDKDTNYLEEKLALFLSYCEYATFPVEGDHKSSSEWLSSASDNLMKVELIALNNLKESLTASN